jgi:hypothetical protein
MKEVKSVHFSFPKFVNSTVSDSSILKEHLSQSINGVYPNYIGTYSFKTKSIDSNVDSVRAKKNLERYKEYSFDQFSDKVSTNGLDLFVDYQNTVFAQRYSHNKELLPFYAVYLVNNSSLPKRFKGKDSWVFGLQEAVQNSSNYYDNWRPIEMRGWDFCGMGNWSKILLPNEYAVILFPKYEGNLKTKVRVRIQNGESIYVSESFEGIVNESQFYFKDSASLDEITKDNHPMAGYYWFYGANPILKLGALSEK